MTIERRNPRWNRSLDRPIELAQLLGTCRTAVFALIKVWLRSWTRTGR
jgi:hypothetical protein